MKPISEDRLRTLLVELHRLIEVSANDAAEKLSQGSIDSEPPYPTNGELTEEEASALRSLRIDLTAQRALAKILADTSASVLFHFFCVMDAVGDPADSCEDIWMGAPLAEPNEDDHPMLHDAFFDTYWDYRKTLGN